MWGIFKCLVAFLINLCFGIRDLQLGIIYITVYIYIEGSIVKGPKKENMHEKCLNTQEKI